MKTPDNLPPFPPVQQKCKTCNDDGMVPAMVETATGLAACPYLGEPCPDCQPELLTPEAVRSKLGEAPMPDELNEAVSASFFKLIGEPEAPSAETPETSAIFKLLDQAFLHETGYEHRFALRQGARIAVEELERERNALTRWKQEALTVEAWWQKIDDAVRARSDIQLGDFVHKHALRLIEERDALKAELARAEERVSELKSDREILHQDGERWREIATSTQAERDRLRAALANIAKQLMPEEMDDHTCEHADWQGGYKQCVFVAREALTPNEPK